MSFRPRGRAKERAQEALREQPGATSCAVCGGRWERATMRDAIHAFEQHDCAAGEAARARRAARYAEEHYETACPDCGWVAVTEKWRSNEVLAEHLAGCPARG